MLSDNTSSPRWLTSVLWLIAIAIFGYEMSSLYSTPLYDSYLWWGDESWLMLEFRSQILSGYFHHPFAFGSSLHLTSGLLFSNMWITAVLYGLPAAIAQHIDLVSLGRTITGILAAAMLVPVYRTTRRAGAGRLASVLAVVLVVTTRTFFLTSHSARYDIVSSFAIVVFFGWLIELSRKRVSSRTSFYLGLALTGSLLISVHILLALAFAVPLVVLRSAEDRWKDFALFAIGAALPIVLFVLIAVSSGAHSLFGYTGTSGFFSQVQNVPAFRPFSRSVQIANIEQRLDMALRLAGPLTLLAACAVVITLIPGLRRRRSLPLWWLPIAIVLSWLLFESSAPTSYLIYIVPVVAVSTAVLLSTLPAVVLSLVAVVAAVLLPLGTFSATALGDQVSRNNDAAVQAAARYIREHPQPGPTLTINLGVHGLLDEKLPIMTTQFIEFPASDLSVDSVLRQNNVHYMLLYQSPLHPDYMREILPLTRIATARGTLVFSRVAPMTDIARDYFDRTSVAGLIPDTLQLYQLHD